MGDYDCVLSDYLMTEMDGVELSKKVKERRESAAVSYNEKGLGLGLYSVNWLSRRKGEEFP